jgi:hypothetical protein
LSVRHCVEVITLFLRSNLGPDNGVQADTFRDFPQFLHTNAGIFWSGNSKGTTTREAESFGYKILLKRILEKQDVKWWPEFNWLRIEYSCGRFVNMATNHLVPLKQGIS